MSRNRVPWYRLYRVPLLGAAIILLVAALMAWGVAGAGSQAEPTATPPVVGAGIAPTAEPTAEPIRPDDDGQVELPNAPPKSPDDLDAISSLEYWHLLAAGLPLVVSLGIFKGKSKQTQAMVAVLVYAAYATLGEAIKGSFATMDWTTPTLVLASFVKVAGISYGSYRTLWQAFPLPQLIEEKTGGDPRSEAKFFRERGYTDDPEKAGVYNRDRPA